MSSRQQLTERKELADFVNQAGNLGQLAQLTAVLDQQRTVKGIARVREAEESAAIRHLTGKESPAAAEEMQTIVFGNVTHQAPRPEVKPALSGLAKLGIAAALVASGVGAGAAIPLAISALTKDVPAAIGQSTNTTTDRDYSIGDVMIEEPK